MAPADEVISNIVLHFCLLKKRHCNENLAVKGGYEYHDQTCGVWTWVVGCAFENLLVVESPSKNTLIVRKEKRPEFHLLHPKYPYMLLKYPSKNGVFEM
jgi:hypothetical protein